MFYWAEAEFFVFDTAQFDQTAHEGFYSVTQLRQNGIAVAAVMGIRCDTVKVTAQFHHLIR